MWLGLSPGAPPPEGDHAVNERVLFIASCVALAATSMSFAIRGDILGDFEVAYVEPYVATIVPEISEETPQEEAANPVKRYAGVIATVAFWSFGLAILFGGPLCDLLGMGFLLRFAAVCHIGGVLLTIFAWHYWVVVIATFIVGVANGVVEAVCNPLIATIYPEQKTRKLTIFHAWFPGGIVIGGVLAFLLSQVGFEAGSEYGWQVKMGLILVPSFIYLFMILGQQFPPTERVAAGVSFSDMFREIARKPLFILILTCMWLTAATELGPGAWIANIYNEVMSELLEPGQVATAGILVLVWGNGLMYLLRQFGSGITERLTPIALIACTAPIAAAGLVLFSYATTPIMWFLAATLLFVGVCWWWPTMLGITSERFPRTGALGLAVVGAMGAFSTAISGPVMGWINDTFGADRVLVIWAILPVAIALIFGALYVYDKAKGGYAAQVERLQRTAEQTPAE